MIIVVVCHLMIYDSLISLSSVSIQNRRYEKTYVFKTNCEINNYRTLHVSCTADLSSVVLKFRCIGRDIGSDACYEHVEFDIIYLGVKYT